MPYILYASIPCSVDQIKHTTDKVKLILDSHGGEFQGSGFGFGNRDIDWRFESCEPAADALDDLKAAFPAGKFSVELHEDEE